MEPQNQAPQAAPVAPSDPFANFNPAPAAPEPAPAAPAEPVAPAPVAEPQPFVPYQGDPNVPSEPTEPVAAPTEPVAPTPPAPTEPAPAEPEQYQSYEDYMNSVIGNVPETVEAPNLEDVDQSDPAAIKGFFDDLIKTAVTQAETNIKKEYAVREAETRQWNEALETYPSLRSNPELRATIHAVRMDGFRRGVAMSPTQAAQYLLKSMNQQYARGIADNQVHTTIESVQPTGGGSVEVPQVTSHTDQLRAIQDGGEVALAAILDAEVKAGRL